jgi:hypothetical protein
MFDETNKAYPIEALGQGVVGMRDSNPTLRENIARKIQYHKDEVVRLESIAGKMTVMLDVNLRDLREAMNF